MGWNAEPAEDAIRETGYWNMTPAQRAGWANEMLVEHTTSPEEGPKMYDMGALDQAAALDEARQERKAQILLGRYEPVGSDRPEKEERVRKARLMNRISGVMGGWGVGTDQDKEAAATVEELERLRDWSAARLERQERLTRFPAEPALSDGLCVVTFSRTYQGRTYSYAALRVPSGAHEGTWVVTGHQSPAYVSWEELMIWVEKGTPSHQTVVIATVGSWISDS